MSGERPTPTEPGRAADGAGPAPAAPRPAVPAEIEQTIAEFAQRFTTEVHTLREDIVRQAPDGAAPLEPPPPEPAAPEPAAPETAVLAAAPPADATGPRDAVGTSTEPSPRPHPAAPPAAPTPAPDAPRRGRARWLPATLVLLVVLLAALALLVGLALRARPGDRPASSQTAPTEAAGGTSVAAASAPTVAAAPTAGVAPTTEPTATAAPGASAGLAAAPVAAATPTVAATPAAPLAAERPASPRSASPASATPGGQDATAVWRRAIAAEAGLRSGRFTATLTYPDGTRATAEVAFDLGSGPQPPRLHLTSTYQSAAGTRTTEYIIIGNTGWQRGPDDRWTPAPGHEGVWGQIQTYLPHADAATRPALERNGDAAVLRWADAGSNADVALTVDPASGVPRELRRTTRGAGLVLVVAYTGWNVPVDITAPAGT